MLRHIKFSVALVCFLLPSCFLVHNRGESRPPQDEAGARKWWDDTLEQAEPETLRAWWQASEYHRQHKSSALYMASTYLGQTMVGPYYFDQYYPTPIPPQFTEKVQARLAAASAKKDKTPTVSLVQYRNCSRDEAITAWYGTR